MGRSRTSLQPRPIVLTLSVSQCYPSCSHDEIPYAGARQGCLHRACETCQAYREGALRVESEVAVLILLQYLFASLVFSTLSLYMVKVSMILLIQRLFNRSMLPFWTAFLVLGIASVISVAGGCSYSSCSNLLARWIVAVVFDILTEVVIIVLPIYCIRAIQMQPMPKIKVQASFFSRLAVVLFSSLTLRAISRFHLTGKPSTAVVLPIVFGQLEVCISLCIASILPCFRIIFQSSEKVPTGFSANEYSHEPKPESVSPHRDSFGLGSVNSHHASGALPRTKKPDHSAGSSQDMDAAHSSHSTGRISSSSIAPSGATGLSQQALVL
jgi:hypothetical protein